ncbi:hypothetical protein DPMN_062676 [Dreissena polymorpha]|uniref:Uncharacterized protein n=1 Tax=Dreissena polymorpha TaxID=45954 RepID=A0A9D4C949_DREPO|nr:hypothetical protein DPMN_062676 [Dreissena polymorpha]
MIAYARLHKSAKQPLYRSFYITCPFPECSVNPSPDVCKESQMADYYTYSSKSDSCVRIRGCYSIYDRNVFLSRDDCRRGCFIYNGVTPSGEMDPRE